MTNHNPNPHRGEVQASVDGQSYMLKLTLGALAEIEQALALDLLEISERFETGQISAGDCLHVLAAAFRAGGNDLSDTDVAAMTFEGGPAGAFKLVAQLFIAAFPPADGS